MIEIHDGDETSDELDENIFGDGLSHTVSGHVGHLITGHLIDGHDCTSGQGSTTGTGGQEMTGHAGHAGHAGHVTSGQIISGRCAGQIISGQIISGQVISGHCAGQGQGRVDVANRVEPSTWNTHPPPPAEVAM